MFKTKVSFELVRRPMFYLCLVLAFNGKASDARHKEFGCEFDSNDYNMIRNNKKQPVWSDVPMKTYTGNNFDDIGEPIKKIIFSEDSILNEFTLFTEFVKGYKSISGPKNLESYFNNYDVPIESKKQYYEDSIGVRKNRDPASYLIQDLHALSQELQVSPYLVSAYVEPMEVNFWNITLKSQSDRITEDQNIKTLLQKPVQDHLAAIIRIKIKNRTGYILIDPGYASGLRWYGSFVVYVMDDGLSPHGETLRGPATKSERLKIALGDQKGNPFILAKYEDKHVLYYVGKPYCSFMENTVKANLMLPYHGAVKRKNGDGEISGYFVIKITSRALRFHSDLFKKENEATLTLTSEIQNTLSMSYPEVMNIVGQLQFIQTAVLDDRQFLKHLTDLTETLGLDNTRWSYWTNDYIVNEPTFSQKAKKIFKKACGPFVAIGYEISLLFRNVELDH